MLEDVARLLNNFGAAVTVLDGLAGADAERKLLRSVFYKRMSAAIVEALAAASVLGLDDWLTDVITEELTDGGPRSVDRIVTGTNRHAARRADDGSRGDRCWPTWASITTSPTPRPCCCAGCIFRGRPAGGDLDA